MLHNVNCHAINFVFNLQESKTQIEIMERQISELDEKLNRTIEKRRRLAVSLKLSENASDELILDTIDHLKQSDSLHRDRLERMHSELKDLRQNFDVITEQKNLLKKSRDFLSQQLRAVNLQKRRFDDRPNRNTPVRPTRYVPNKYTQGIRGDTTDRIIINPVNVVLPPLGVKFDNTKMSNEKPRPATATVCLPPIGVAVEARYCVVCRQQFHGGGAMNDQPEATIRGAGCRLHYRAYRSGRYECCRNEVPHSAGCLVVKHLYVVVRKERDTTVFEITDGSKVYNN